MRARNDWSHTREVGDCSYPRDEPWIPPCEACQMRRNKLHPTHTWVPNECRYAEGDGRNTQPRKRKTNEPHEPVTPANAEPTAAAPARLGDKELGQDGEELVEAADQLAPSGGTASSSSASGSRPAEGSGDASASAAGSQQAEGAEARRGRGRDQEQRHRRTFEDAGVNPENASDRSNFDIVRVVRVFRTNREAAIRLSLRKLHVRWWHAPATTMHKFLERVGVADRVLNLIPEVCQTCRVCREWAKPGPGNQCNINMPDTFNQQVEADLLFVYKHIVFHLLDRCSRWHGSGSPAVAADLHPVASLGLPSSAYWAAPRRTTGRR